mmetsp:Transcript_6638/g.27067  ORF Transcript_6638/g.27067 Transcript_6638/m.27067 type:complete len:305 (+) Transcript_6638:218-1132(+)
MYDTGTSCLHTGHATASSPPTDRRRAAIAHPVRHEACTAWRHGSIIDQPASGSAKASPSSLAQPSVSAAAVAGTDPFGSVPSAAAAVSGLLRSSARSSTGTRHTGHSSLKHRARGRASTTVASPPALSSAPGPASRAAVDEWFPSRAAFRARPSESRAPSLKRKATRGLWPPMQASSSGDLVSSRPSPVAVLAVGRPSASVAAAAVTTTARGDGGSVPGEGSVPSAVVLAFASPFFSPSVSLAAATSMAGASASMSAPLAMTRYCASGRNPFAAHRAKAVLAFSILTSLIRSLPSAPPSAARRA